MEKLMIIDGNSIINRAFYAIRNLTAPDGLNTNGIYGFLNVLFKHIDEERPQYIAVAFDLKGPTFRHKEYELYKAQRKGMPEELAEQMPVLKDVLRAMNIAVLECEGYEADDIIGTVSRMCNDTDLQCKILTGDKDDLQLVTKNTHVLLTTTSKGQTKTEVYTPDEVVQKYGITPDKLVDMKGLMGDASDNIPGVSGVGEKTAMNLIGEYQTLENLYENLENGKIKGALLTKLKDGRDMAFLSRSLSTIVKDVPIQTKIDEMKTSEPDNPALLEMFRRLGFNSFIKRFELEENLPSGVRDDFIEGGTDDAIKHIKTSKTMEYLITDDAVFVCAGDEVYKITDEVGKLKEVFENPDIKKTGTDVKNNIVWLNERGIGFSGLSFDCMVAAYLLDPARSEYGISGLIVEYLSYSAEGAAAVRSVGALGKALKEKLSADGMLSLYTEVELPLVKILADMQIIGFKTDGDMLAEFSEKLQADITRLEDAIYSASGEVFNINSPKQMGVVLFEKLGLPVLKKTKSGPSTDVDTLTKLKNHHGVIDYILEYRHLAKLKSTYTDGLAAVINPKTGKIHSSFNQTVTATGRISSTEPNMQNIPVRLKLGRELRKVFVADSEDYILVDADYSQIELRVLAHITGDPALCEAFEKGADIHTETAAKVFGVPAEMVTDEMRIRAKAVNFGIVYGIGDFSLAEDIGVTRREAREFIDKYLDTYKGVAKFMKDTVAFAKEQGYVKTLLDRRRYIPEITSKNYNIRSFGERVAMNAPVQGSAADIIKVAMVNVYNSLAENTPKSHLILQVHDELIVQAHISEAEQVEEILKTEMENAFPLSVPLVTEVKKGRSWFDAK